VEQQTFGITLTATVGTLSSFTIVPDS